MCMCGSIVTYVTVGRAGVENLVFAAAECSDPVLVGRSDVHYGVHQPGMRPCRGAVTLFSGTV